ncbi:zinc-dependent metalloprotease [Glycomyces buryatensis]|uniref:Zinc-dependent metalloprotease n=1 Tax=Glycomyces buryatensis TaxID=2570927 RepID=A0A4S8QL02_9ACTN|nr:zinc-dependent metalloprotease [Glycomyces buryatensis]THV42109.1 zinc-dependent metalloprotease [Glycomyces buryatensis]
MGSDIPFGFGNLGGDLPDPNDPRVQQMMQQLQQMMAQSLSSGPVNWQLAKQLAESELASENTVGPADQAAVSEAVRLADLWLDAATAWPSGVTATDAWTRKQWIDQTEASWKQLAEPLAGQMGEAMQTLVPEEMSGMLGPMADLMKGVGSALFGAQMGQALAKLAGEVLSSTDVGLPLGKTGVAALLPNNVAAYAEGLELPVEEVRLFVALREAATHQLYTHAPWLRSHLLGALDAYAREIRIDESAIEEAMSEIDPTDPEAAATMDLSEVFKPEDTEQQKAALARLATTLALVTGWINVVVAEAADGRLPTIDRLLESARRRRASGGPAEQTFEALVGLQLDPTKVRAATRLWKSLGEARGIEGREGVWAHPDLMPGASDLEHPEGFVTVSEAMGDLDMSMFDQLAVNDPRPPEEDEGDEGDEGEADKDKP